MAGRDTDGSPARMRGRLAATAAATAAILALGASSALAIGFSAGPATITATEGVAFSGQVGQFTTDPGGNMIATPQQCADAASGGVGSIYSATIDWGDGVTTPGTVSFVSSTTQPGLAPGTSTIANCTYAVSGSHTYAEDRAGVPVAVHPTLTAGGVAIMGCGGIVMPGTMMCQMYGPGGDVNSTANVGDAPLTGVANGISATEGVPFSGVVGAFNDGNSNAPLRDYTATISWGDGTSSAGAFTPNPDGSTSVSGTHTYAHAGSFPTSVAIHDAGGASTAPSGTANVAAAPQPATTRAAPSKSKPKHKLRCAKGKKLVGKGKKAHCVKVHKAKGKAKPKTKKH